MHGQYEFDMEVVKVGTKLLRIAKLGDGLLQRGATPAGGLQAAHTLPLLAKVGQLQAHQERFCRGSRRAPIELSHLGANQCSRLHVSGPRAFGQFVETQNQLDDLDAFRFRDRLKQQAFQNAVVATKRAGLEFADDHRHQDPDRRSTRAITFSAILIDAASIRRPSSETAPRPSAAASAMATMMR